MEEILLLHIVFKILCIVFILCNIYTQEESKLIFSFNIGLSKPGSPAEFSDNWGSGYNLGLGIGKSISSRFQIQAVLNFNNFSLDHPVFIKNINPSTYNITAEEIPYLTATGGERNLLSLLTRIKYLYSRHGNSKVLPYAFIGAGMFRQYIDKIQILPSRIDIDKKTETSLLVSAGLGTDLLLEKHTNLFFEIAPEICFIESDMVIYYSLKIGFLVK